VRERNNYWSVPVSRIPNFNGWQKEYGAFTLSYAVRNNYWSVPVPVSDICIGT